MNSCEASEGVLTPGTDKAGLLYNRHGNRHHASLGMIVLLLYSHSAEYSLTMGKVLGEIFLNDCLILGMHVLSHFYAIFGRG